MKVINLSYDDFCKFNDGRFRVHHDLPSLISPTTKNTLKIPKRIFESKEDFERLKNLKLVWYKNADGKGVKYDDKDARNIELKNDPDDEDAYPEGSINKIKKLTKLLTDEGLTKNIEIISVTDSKLGQEIIVDGCNRAVAIYRLFKQKKWHVIENLLSHQSYGIHLINFQSPDALNFFPSDIQSLYRQQSNKSESVK